jgi:hypothetical protein
MQITIDSPLADRVQALWNKHRVVKVGPMIMQLLCAGAFGFALRHILTAR